MKQRLEHTEDGGEDSNIGLRGIICPGCGKPYGLVSDPFSERQCPGCGFVGVFALETSEIDHEASMVVIGLGGGFEAVSRITRPGEP